MTTYYLSPINYSYFDYLKTIHEINSFGWKVSMLWPEGAFRDNYLKEKALAKAVRAISRSDLYIAYYPGTISMAFEIGLAYKCCGEVFIAAKDPVHFTQSGLADAYLTSLKGINRACCTRQAIPAMLRQQYLYLVDEVS